MRQRVYLCIFPAVSVYSAETCKRILSVNVHCTRATDTFPTGPPEGQRRVHFVLDLDQCVKNLRTFACISMERMSRARAIHHRTGLIQIYLVRL
jgi:hypothetical protein